jgi:hypothetical protein
MTARLEPQRTHVFRIDRSAEGAFGVHAPSLLWFKDDTEGTFETILSPLLELFRYREDPVRGRELRLLFSTIQVRSGGSGGEGGWSFLGGLLGHRTTREGDGLLRLFYFLEL